MALNISPFGQQSPLQMRGAPIIDKPGWGPPDMAEQIQKGIASLYGLYRGAEGAAETKKHVQDIAKNPGQRAAALSQPGGPYAAPGALPTVAQGGVGPDNPYAPTPASRAAGGVVPTAPAPGEIESYIRQSAVRRGIDPDVAVRVAKAEGGLDDPIRQSDYRKNGVREPSYGPFQLYMGGGLGNRALEAGIDPRDPTQWRRGVDFALEEAAKKGWGQWYGAAKAGIGNRQGLNYGGDPGLKVATAGQPNVVPQRPDERPVTENAPAYASGVAPVEAFRASIPQMFPNASITSDYRSPEYNKKIGGAQNSQHTHGTALDIDTSRMDDAQKAALVDTAIAQGARGIGWYNDGSMHIDFRTNGPAAWGPNRSKTSLGSTPAWFQERANRLLAGQVPAVPAQQQAPAPAGPTGNVAQAPPQATPQVAPQVGPQVAQGGPGGPQPGPQAPPNPTPITGNAQPLFNNAPQFSDPSANQPGLPQQQPYQVAGDWQPPPQQVADAQPSLTNPATPGVSQPLPNAATAPNDPRNLPISQGGILPDPSQPAPGNGIAVDPLTGQRYAVDPNGNPLPPQQQPQRQPQQPQQPQPQQPQPQVARAGGGNPLPPQAASAVAGLGLDPDSFQDLDPRWIMALGSAMGSGDPNLVNSVASSINSVVGARGSKAGDWTIVSDGQGGFVRHNKRTNEVLPVGPGPGQRQGAILVQPGDTELRQKYNLKDDGRAYEIKFDQRGNVSDISPIADPRRDDDKSFTQEHTLRQDFMKDPAVQKYLASEQGLLALGSTFDQGNAVADQIGVVNVMKTIDPTSTVSAGEDATLKNAPGWPEQVRSAWNRFMGAGGKFSKETRQQFYNTLRANVLSARPYAERQANTTRNQAKAYKLDPERTLPWKPEELPLAEGDRFKDKQDDAAVNRAREAQGGNANNPIVIDGPEMAIKTDGYWVYTDPKDKVTIRGYTDPLTKEWKVLK